MESSEYPDKSDYFTNFIFYGVTLELYTGILIRIEFSTTEQEEKKRLRKVLQNLTAT